MFGKNYFEFKKKYFQIYFTPLVKYTYISIHKLNPGPCQTNTEYIIYNKYVLKVNIIFALLIY